MVSGYDWKNGGRVTSLLSSFLFSIILLIHRDGLASDGWSLSLRLTDLARNQYKLVAGADSFATDGFDNLYDFSALSAGPQGSATQTVLTTQVYFYHPDYSATAQLLLQDIRSNDFTGSKSWQLTVSSDQVGMFHWDWVIQQRNSCQQYGMTLTDLSDGRSVDLSSASSFDFSQNGSTRSFMLMVSALGPRLQVSRPLGLWSPRQGSESVFLSWLPEGSGTTYRLFRSETSGAGYMPVTNTPIRESYFVDRGLSGGKTYYYVVKAVNGDGCESDYSTEAAVPLP
jgi:hypothetical protein